MRRPCPSSGLQAVCLFVTAIALAVAAARGAEESRPAVPPTDARAATTMVSPTAPASPRTTASGTKQQRLREGTTWTDRLGVFKLTGDRATFTTNDDGTVVLGLENLSLERVIHTLRDDPAPGGSWKVSGIVTEFEGRNHFLITRAVQVVKPGAVPKTDRPTGTARPEDGGRPIAPGAGSR